MKIALIGSAPSSVQLAPFQDPTWQIWGCSPGAYPFAGPHADQWFELHRWEPQVPGMLGTGKQWYSPEYCEFMTRFKGPVWTSDPPPEVPNAKAYPVEEMVEKYGPYFMTSSLSWMFAMALETPGVTDIGLWGVDMSAQEEYEAQKSGCQYFITLATQRGIKVTVPPESDLLQPNYLYGVAENSPMMIKLTARREELQQRKAAAEQRFEQAKCETHFLNGALDDLDYMVKTWVTYQSWIEPTMGKTGNEVRAEKPITDLAAAWAASGGEYLANKELQSLKESMDAKFKDSSTDRMKAVDEEKYTDDTQMMGVTAD